jgi:hypothetical protein
MIDIAANAAAACICIIVIIIVFYKLFNAFSLKDKNN